MWVQPSYPASTPVRGWCFASSPAEGEILARHVAETQIHRLHLSDFALSPSSIAPRPGRARAERTLLSALNRESARSRNDPPGRGNGALCARCAGGDAAAGSGPAEAAA